jgi:hypothetical protein
MERSNDSGRSKVDIVGLALRGGPAFARGLLLRRSPVTKDLGDTID